MLSLKYRKIFPKRFANPMHKRVHNTRLFIRFASLEGTISCILNSVCINLYTIYHKHDLFSSDSIFYAL